MSSCKYFPLPASRSPEQGQGQGFVRMWDNASPSHAPVPSFRKQVLGSQLSPVHVQMSPPHYQSNAPSQRGEGSLGEAPPAPQPYLGATGGHSITSPIPASAAEAAPSATRPSELDGAVGNYRLSNMLKSIQLCLQCSRCLHCLTQK